MSELQSEIEQWSIEEPYEFTEEDLDILDEFPVQEAADWKKKEYKPLKDRIRNYYKGLQNGTCCYCRLPIHEGSDNVEIEHIIDKNRRLDFIFEARNLVVSCHKCNFTKGRQRVMHHCPPANDYPTSSDDFRIIHGHYDDYFEHIGFRADSTYHPITGEGEFTINICGLARPGLAEQRETVLMYQDDELVADVIEIRNSENNVEKINALIQKLQGMRDQQD